MIFPKMTRRPPVVLSGYLAKTYFLSFLGLLVVLLGLIYLLDTIELLRRAVKRDEVPLILILQMGAFKLPEVGQVVLPFAILFSGMLTFWGLTRRYELAVIRAAGLSVWQFLTPIMGVAFLCGVVYVTIINPLGAVFLGKFEQFETKYLGAQRNLVSVFDEGFWIRQPESVAGEVILNAEKIRLPEWTFKNVMGLAFNDQGQLVSRLDAEGARLEEGHWLFENVHISGVNGENTYQDWYELPTTMTRAQIEESFSKPEAVPFWQIPSFMKVLESTGFDTTRMRMHFHTLLSLPLMFVAMVLLAASVSLQPPRSGQTLFTIGLGIAIAIFIFFISSYLQALGSSQQLPPVLAAWAPALISFLLGIAALLNLEDG